MLLNVAVEATYDGLIKPLGLPTILGMVQSSKVVFSPKHGADSIKELADKLPAVMGEHTRRGAVSIHRMVQERIGDNGGRGSPKRYGAKKFREQFDNHQHELVFKLRLRSWSKKVHGHELRGPRRWKQLQMFLMFTNDTALLCAGMKALRGGEYVIGHMQSVMFSSKDVVNPRTARISHESRVVSQT